MTIYTHALVNSIAIPAIITVNDKTITMSVTDTTITVNISRCKDYVYKLNKKSVSTCDLELLQRTLKENSVYCEKMINHFFNFSDETNAKQTIAGFFSNMSESEFIAYIHGVNKYQNSRTHAINKIVLEYLFCTDHTAKMSGMISCSTYVKYNRYCLARRKNCPNAICKYCFAYDQTENYSAQAEKLKKAHWFLTNIELCAADIPAIPIEKYLFFRFEAFGDIANTLQFDNYNLIAAVNPGVNFTLWSKNPGIIQKAINAGTTISDNLVIGLSSLYLNTPEMEKAKKYKFIRFLFTVYDDEYIEEHNIVINCGAKHCLSCGICYKYLHEFPTGLMIINERKK